MKFDITLKQYELIYRIVASVGEKLSHGAGRSCQFYNVNGAFILEKIFKVKARPIMGAAFIKLTNDKGTLSFAGKEGSNFYSSPEAFHCWIETENNILDFTAPEYREALNQAGTDNRVKRHMFQRSKTSMSESPLEISNVGDFYFESNPELTNYLLTTMNEKLGIRDLTEICLEWCKISKKSKNGLSTFNITNDLGQVTPITPVSRKLTGSW
jgi:hypothetical protein